MGSDLRWSGPLNQPPAVAVFVGRGQGVEHRLGAGDFAGIGGWPWVPPVGTPEGSGVDNPLPWWSCGAFPAG